MLIVTVIGYCSSLIESVSNLTCPKGNLKIFESYSFLLGSIKTDCF